LTPKKNTQNQKIPIGRHKVQNTTTTQVRKKFIEELPYLGNVFFILEEKKRALGSQFWLNYFMDHRFGYITQLTPKDPKLYLKNRIHHRHKVQNTTT
jgi:hypothetical protein